MNASLHMRISQMPAVADTGQFMVVYPQSTNVEHDGTMVPDWSLEEHPENDVAFIQQVLREVGDRYTVNPDRVYATGWNTGGMMCYQLACGLSDKLAAIATVGGTAMRTQDCQPRSPMPVLYVQATAEALPNYQFNSDSYEMLSVQEYLDLWLEHNQCHSSSERQQIASPDSLDLFAAEQESWSDCQAAVLRYRPWQKKNLGSIPELDEALHQSTSAKIWSFFREHINTALTTSTESGAKNLTSVTLFPNPVIEELTVRGFLAKAGTLTMALRNNNGQLVWEERVQLPSGVFTLDRGMPEHLPGGIYHLLLANNQQIISRKLVRHEP
jgi:polyhydroxybutyrate depolymerase